MASKTLTIGRLAQAAGVGVETIRYYQNRGLIQQPDKPLNGYRVYPQDTIARIQFIKRAKKLGFTLDEIASLLSLDSNQCQATQQLATSKLQQLNQEIAALQHKAQALQCLVEECRVDRESGCPVIRSLTGDE